MNKAAQNHPIVVAITAATLLNLLLKRHTEDVCIPECKSGASWSSSKTRIFDLWTMKKSYSKPMTCIYEIKVSRQDFLRDDKWQTYLPYCTDFYFVAPAGIIDPSEVPADAGLLLSSKTGTRLFCKKKAPHRNVEIPISLFKYVLMTRSKIVASTYTNTDNGKDMQAFWQGWLEKKDVKQQLGYHVSRKIRKLYAENIEQVRVRQEQLDGRLEKLETVRIILKELGFDEKNLGWNYRDKVCDRIAEINAGIPEKDIIKHLENAVANLKNTINVIQNAKN